MRNPLVDKLPDSDLSVFNYPGEWVAEQRGGLCNNLKCLLSTMRLAERDGSALVTSAADLVSVYDGLDYVAPDDIKPHMQRHRDWRFLVFDDDPIPGGFSSKRESKGFGDADPRGRNIDHEFDRIPPAMRQIYLEVISRLSVKPDLVEEINAFCSANPVEESVAVHMRTWMTDHWDKAPKRHAHYFDLAQYEALVDRHDRLFICSDNASYLQHLVSRFGDRIICYKPSPNLVHSQVAFVELNLLARSKRLFGSSLSTFTEMAWWLGGCKAEVKLIAANR